MRQYGTIGLSWVGVREVCTVLLRAASELPVHPSMLIHTSTTDEWFE